MEAFTFFRRKFQGTIFIGVYFSEITHISYFSWKQSPLTFLYDEPPIGIFHKIRVFNRHIDYYFMTKFSETILIRGYLWEISEKINPSSMSYHILNLSDLSFKFKCVSFNDPAFWFCGIPSSIERSSKSAHVDATWKKKLKNNNLLFETAESLWTREILFQTNIIITQIGAFSSFSFLFSSPPLRPSPPNSGEPRPFGRFTPLRASDRTNWGMKTSLNWISNLLLLLLWSIW